MFPAPTSAGIRESRGSRIVVQLRFPSYQNVLGGWRQLRILRNPLAELTIRIPTRRSLADSRPLGVVLVPLGTRPPFLVPNHLLTLGFCQGLMWRPDQGRRESDELFRNGVFLGGTRPWQDDGRTDDWLNHGADRFSCRSRCSARRYRAKYYGNGGVDTPCVTLRQCVPLTILLKYQRSIRPKGGPLWTAYVDRCVDVNALPRATVYSPGVI